MFKYPRIYRRFHVMDGQRMGLARGDEVADESRSQ